MGDITAAEMQAEQALPGSAEMESILQANGQEPVAAALCPYCQSLGTALAQAERREQEKQATLDRLRHTFLSSVNHEMRTPLALLFQSLAMLEDPRFGPLTEEQFDALAVLRRQADSLGRMFEGLTRVAAYLSKQGTVRPVWALLKPVFDSVIPLAEFRARSKEITVETDIAPDLPPLPVDVKEMEEVLMQLMDNAIKFNRPGGRIWLTIRADADSVILTVADTGVGIPSEKLALIWDVFEQGADPLRRAREGLGIGLALVRCIVESHHGKVEVETVPGRGSVFRVRLPRYKQHIPDRPHIAKSMH